MNILKPLVEQVRHYVLVEMQDSTLYQVKLLLEFLICVVNTKLFKAVGVKRLKPVEDKAAKSTWTTHSMTN